MDPALIDDFLHKLAYARRNAFSLDEQNHYIDQLSEGQFVQALFYAGRWMAARGILPSPFDIFWLKVDEVLPALRGAPVGLQAILVERRAQFEEWKALFPPPCLGLPNPLLDPRPAISVDTHPGVEPSSLPVNTLKGEPASRGQVSGRARISNEVSLPTDIKSGDILVVPYASPLLIHLLPAVAGVVLDYGGPGDHFAITAREFGLPAVCGTNHATRLIPEGALVNIDANAGLVTWI
jgi:pyruvate,water dikinase